MIERLQRIATFLHRFRPFIVVLSALSLGIFSLSLFENPWINGGVWLIPSLLILCWCLVFYSVIALFQQIPEKGDRSENWSKRTSNSIRRGGLWLTGVALILLSGSLLVLSYQLLRTWIMG